MPKEVIVNGFDITKQILHGLTPQQYIDLMEFQNFKCYLSGIGFKHDKSKQKFIDVNGKAPPIDHDHSTGNIRGILSEKVNWLERQWELGSYGKLSKPIELTEYQKNPPALRLLGEVKYK